jgi:hypothetical protein
MKLKKFFPLIIIILVLNLIWEFSHYGLYLDLTRIPSTIHSILASFVDVFLIMFIVFLVSIKNKNIKWINKCGEKNYFFVIIFGLILAFVWEKINLSLNRWIYSVEMPLFFGVGLSPLLQLAITGSLGLWFNELLRKLIQRKT